MRVRDMFVVFVIMLAFLFCSTPVRVKRYPVSAKFAPTNPLNVSIMRNMPRRKHIQLGEVIIDPSPSTPRMKVQRIMKERTMRKIA